MCSDVWVITGLWPKLLFMPCAIFLCHVVFGTRADLPGNVLEIARDLRAKRMDPGYRRLWVVFSAVGACATLETESIQILQGMAPEILKHPQISVTFNHARTTFARLFSGRHGVWFSSLVCVPLFDPRRPPLTGGASRRLDGGVSILEGQEVSNREAVAAKVLARHAIQRYGPP